MHRDRQAGLRSSSKRPDDALNWRLCATVRASHAFLRRPSRPAESRSFRSVSTSAGYTFGYTCQRQRPSPRRERASDLLLRGSGGRI